MKAELSDLVLDQVRRLGGKLVPVPAEAPCLIKTARGERELPAPIRQWGHGIQWPKKLSFQGKIDGLMRVRIRLDVSASLEDYRCARDRDWYCIGELGGGNVLLLVDLDAAGLEDPPVSKLVHDEVDREEADSFMDFDRLSEFLQRLEPMGKRRG